MNPRKRTSEDPNQWAKELYRLLLALKDLLPHKAPSPSDPMAYRTLTEAKAINEEIGVLLQKIQHQAVEPQLSLNESELLREINKGFPSDFWNRYHNLQKKRRDETLSDEEQAELLQCSDNIEIANVERVRHIVRLAELQKVALPILVEQLKITPAAYA